MLPDPKEVEEEVLAQCEELDKLEEDEEEKDLGAQKVIELSTWEWIQDMTNKAIKQKIRQDKLLSDEWLNRFRIVLIQGNDTEKLCIRLNDEKDEMVIYVQEIPSEFVDTLFTDSIYILKTLRERIVDTIHRTYATRRPAFTPKDQWVRIQKKNRKLIRQNYKAKANELFDILDLGRVSITVDKKVTIQDKYTGYESTVTTSEKVRASDLPTVMQIELSEKLKMLDTKRFGTEDKDEILAKELSEFVQKENLKEE